MNFLFEIGEPVKAVILRDYVVSVMGITELAECRVVGANGKVKSQMEITFFNPAVAGYVVDVLTFDSATRKAKTIPTLFLEEELLIAGDIVVGIPIHRPFAGLREWLTI